MSGAGPDGLPTRHGDPPLAGVVFDAGLTLIYEGTPAREVAAAALGALGTPVAPAALERAMSDAMAFIGSRWHRGDWWLSEPSVRRLFTTGYRRGLAALPHLAGDEAARRRAADAIYESYFDARHWRVFEDVRPTLDALRADGVPMGVVSDWGHGLEAILLDLELGAYFAFVLVSARIGIGKPDPAVFEMAVGRLGATPGATVYVGDTYVKDVLGARAAGMAPVLLDRARALDAPDCATVHDLRELPDRLGIPARWRPSHAG